MQQKKLEEVVAEFRSAIQDLIDSGHWFGVSIDKYFPGGACDDSSLLLAAYLTDEGFPGAIRISGVSGGRDNELGTHVWLILDGIIIDITGSQFEGYDQPEILISEKDEFLETFEVESEPRIADYRLTSYLPKYHFNEAYEAIRNHIAAR